MNQQNPVLNGSTCLVFFQLFCRGAWLRMEAKSSFFSEKSYWEINPQQGDMMTKVEFVQNLQCFKRIEPLGEAQWHCKRSL